MSWCKFRVMFMSRNFLAVSGLSAGSSFDVTNYDSVRYNSLWDGCSPFCARKSSMQLVSLVSSVSVVIFTCKWFFSRKLTKSLTLEVGQLFFTGQPQPALRGEMTAYSGRCDAFWPVGFQEGGSGLKYVVSCLCLFTFTLTLSLISASWIVLRHRSGIMKTAA
jgi:hypothetical protein